MATLREARRANLIAAGLPPESASDAWFDWVKVGPARLPLPNPPARRRVIHLHDAAHALSGYGTDFVGELEESAFELAAGCGGSWLAWLYDLQGLVGGVVVAPARTAAAWRRGAVSRSVYEVDLEPLLDLPLDEARAAMGVPPGDVPWLRDDRRRLVLTAAVGAVFALAQIVPLIAAPVALALWARRRRP